MRVLLFRFGQMIINFFQLILFILLIFFDYLPSYSKFISTIKIESSGNIDLLLDDKDQIISFINTSSPPIVSFNLKNTKELINGKNSTINIEVFKIIDDRLNFVGSFKYILNPKTNSQIISIPLPDFLNQSETFQFHIFDSSNILHSKFSYDFYADQIIKHPEVKLGLIPEGLDSNVDNSFIETVLRKISFNSFENKIPGIELNNNSYIINLPNSSKSSSNSNNLNNPSLQRTTRDFTNRLNLLRNELSKLSLDIQNTKSSQQDINKVFDKLSNTVNNLSNQFNFLNSSMVNKLNSDFSNFKGDLSINGIIRTNNLSDKTISLSLDNSIKEGEVVLGKVASNTIPVLRFIKPNSNATWTISLPKDLVKDALLDNKLKVKFLWSSNNNLGQSCIWQLDYFSFDIGDILYSNSKNSLSKLVLSPKQELALISTEFEIPTKDLKDVLILKLIRKDTNNINPNLVSFEINYPALSLERF
jgi:hypothetical protein